MATKKHKGSLTGRYKKQHGLHHKHGDKYLKVYWPYIPVAIFVFMGIVTSIYILNTKSSNLATTSISTSSLLSSTNQLRNVNGLSPLNINSQLSTAAQVKANDMALKNYWSPVSPSGVSPAQLLVNSGYNYSTAGDNLAYGFSNTNTLMSTWAGSIQHKANILNTNYTQVGFGIAQAPDFQNKGPQTIVVAFYASPSTNGISGGFSSASLIQPKGQTIARIQTLTGIESYLSIFIVGSIAGLALAVLLIRHGIALRKWAKEGEKLVIKHPVIDVCLVVVVLAGAVLNQTVGLIN
jgi:hypothetical protein